MTDQPAEPPDPTTDGPTVAGPTSEDTTCYTCHSTGKARRGWSGDPSPDGETCPDCNGTGIDATPFGTGSDHCPHCAADWKKSHSPGCPAYGIP